MDEGNTIEFSAFPSGGSVAEILEMQFKRAVALVPSFQNPNKPDQANNNNESKRKKWGIEADSDVTLPEWCMFIFALLVSYCHSFQVKENSVICASGR